MFFRFKHSVCSCWQNHQSDGLSDTDVVLRRFFSSWSHIFTRMPILALCCLIRMNSHLFEPLQPTVPPVLWVRHQNITQPMQISRSGKYQTFRVLPLLVIAMAQKYSQQSVVCRCTEQGAINLISLRWSCYLLRDWITLEVVFSRTAIAAIIFSGILIHSCRE